MQCNVWSGVKMTSSIWSQLSPGHVFAFQVGFSIRGAECELLESLPLNIIGGGETNRSNIRIKVFVHLCSNFVSLFELFVPLAHAQNNMRSQKKSQV